MRRYLLLLLLFFASATSLFAAPQLVVEQLNYDFGEVLQGGKVDFTFRFRNAGDEVLEVGNVRSSCGCTAALLSARRIAPGDMGELQATFDSTRFQGAVTKVISLDSNDPQQPQVSFSLYGNVTAEVVLQPDRVNWGVVESQQPLESRLTISNLSKSTIRLERPKSTNPAVSAELSALQIPPGGQVELLIKAKLPDDQARLGGYVILATDHASYPQLRVPVSARLAK
ncbi:MAG TPA: DUF1573 domain-containing protein [Malonomonas sp.]